ncbi:5' exonuclease Apollo [Syngnathus typhle]|uniref:5' exonuclease Apollo n=1 Tax=Syngnathus typhle TaxID=161592 RepID=UPI002A6B7B6E|nr:5' exonuclease Apollo [Syngnathus typhle]
MSNGKIITNTPVAVDFWHVRRCPESRLFFLSHMHSDHTVGLTSTWANRPIYCSPVTASLVKVKLRVKEKWIHPLEVGDSYLLPLDDIGKENMTVTLIDANHCPGAVMFLFEGYFGTILYTGDFRYSPSMLRELCLATKATIDVLYLDNTNCDPNRSIPSRKQATQQIKEIIRSHPDHNVVLGLYSLGKETLLVDLAREFQTWIEVSLDRMKILRILELPDVFTTEPGAGRIRVVEQREITFAAMCQWNSEQPTLAIYPTSRPLYLFHPKLHVVPYSDHSSYQELVDFVSGLKPSSLLPIVGNGIPGSLATLLPSKKHEILVPESVQHYMRRLPENWNKSSASVRRQYARPLVPKGVVFDSPESSSKKSWECLGPNSSEEEEEEMDTDSVDCNLRESSEKIPTFKNRQDLLYTLKPNLVCTIPEEMLMAQRVPFSQLSQSNFDSLKMLQDTGALLTPRRRAIEEMTSGASNRTGAGPMSDDDDDDTKVSDSDFVPLSSPNHFVALSGSLQYSDANAERLENDILKHVVFPPEDLKLFHPLRSVSRMRSLCPIHKTNVP